MALSPFYRLALRQAMTRTIHRLFCVGCWAVLIGLVLLPFMTGMEPGEFWRW